MMIGLASVEVAWTSAWKDHDQEVAPGREVIEMHMEWCTAIFQIGIKGCYRAVVRESNTKKRSMAASTR